MLILSEKFKSIPVMSLQTGAEIARTKSPVIDPGTLDIVAYSLSGERLEKNRSLLLVRDVREIGDMGIIIDSADEVISETDVVKVQKLLTLRFDPIDMHVIDDKKNKLGKVYDYAFDPLTFTIHQLHVKRPLLRSLQTSELLINRSQIAEINNKTIVVHSATLKQRPKPAAVSEHFVNPFRATSPRPQSSSRSSQ